MFLMCSSARCSHHTHGTHLTLHICLVDRHGPGGVNSHSHCLRADAGKSNISNLIPFLLTEGKDGVLKSGSDITHTPVLKE